MFSNQCPLVPLQRLSFLCDDAKSTIRRFSGSFLSVPFPGAETVLGVANTTQTHGGHDYLQGPGALSPSAYPLKALWNPGLAVHPAEGPMDAPGRWGPLESGTWEVPFRSNE